MGFPAERRKGDLCQEREKDLLAIKGASLYNGGQGCQLGTISELNKSFYPV